jgi:hypothetical protein
MDDKGGQLFDGTAIYSIILYGKNINSIAPESSSSIERSAKPRNASGRARVQKFRSFTSRWIVQFFILSTGRL